MRRDELMKSDLLSEMVLLSSCALILLTLIIFLAVVVTPHTYAAVNICTGNRKLHLAKPINLNSARRLAMRGM